MRIPLFRIWYSTTYTTLLLLTVLVLAITPADTIYQSIRERQFQKLFIIGGVCLLTFLIVLLVYSTRLYTNRTVLAAIPKGYLPIEDGEVGKGVRRMIVKELARSAIVAWDSRPRDLSGQDLDDGIDDEEQGRPRTADSKKEKAKAHKKKKGDHQGVEATILPISARNPPWGHVSHPGWATPSSPDLPNLQYWSVICELPNLIEAKAVSLAPADPAIDDLGLRYPENGPPLPDAQIVTLLQRPRTMGLRDYLARLSEFGLLNRPSLGYTFLAKYEHARFSTASLAETDFRDLMGTFADILNGMVEIDSIVIEEARAAQSLRSDTRSLAPTELSSESELSRSTCSNSALSYRTPMLERQRSVSLYSESFSNAEGTPSPQTAPTAPSRQRDRSIGYDFPETSSVRTQSETGSVLVHDVERRSPSTLLPNSSSSSLRSAQSVIRLHHNARDGDWPYQYNINGG